MEPSPRRLVFQVSVGKHAKSRMYRTLTDRCEDYARRLGVEYQRLEEPVLRVTPSEHSNRSVESYEKHGGYLPIFEKLNALDFLSDFDEVAVIDADVYVRSESPSIFDQVSPTASLAAVVERKMPLSRDYVAKIKGYSRAQFQSLQDVDWRWNRRGAHFFNLGVMVIRPSVMKDFGVTSAREFLSMGENRPFIDGVGNWKWSTDQTLLNYWLKKTGSQVEELDWRWNVLYGAVRKTASYQGFFTHFFLRDLLPDKGENIDALLADVDPRRRVQLTKAFKLWMA